MSREHEEPRRTPRENPLITNPRIRGGEPVFRGTRMPASTLLDYLRGGDGLDTFLDDFPEISREEAERMLDLLRDALPALAEPVTGRPGETVDRGRTGPLPVR